MTVHNLAIFTICSNNYMPMAKVLIESARRCHPDASLYICLADKMLPDFDLYPRDCQIIPAENLGILDFCQFSFRYDIMEFNTALKPFMFLDLLDRGHGTIMYFDPDIEIYAPVESVLEKINGGASFVLTPHLLHPAEGDSEPDDIDIMSAGIYNLGFLGVGANGANAEARAILEWWARRLRYQCVNEQGRGLFVDQKFIDLVPGFADGACILRDPSLNVAYWNLEQRQLTQDGANWRVDGSPLIFFHFSGIDLDNLSQLSKHTSGFRGAAISPPVRELMRHYADQVFANGFREARRIPYAYGRFASGATIPDQARWLFRTDYRDYSEDPFLAFEARVPPRDSKRPPPMSAEELTRHVEAIYASSSWKITRPLRTLKRLIRR